MEWNTQERWRKQVERKLNKLGSMVHGNQDFQADRIADVVEQIAELRSELKDVSERLHKLSVWAQGTKEDQ